MFPLTQTPLFSWLLKEYGPCHYSGESSTTYPLSVTIGGMLYDLKYRAENDAIAKLVLEFLSRPYVKSIHPKLADQPWFTRYGQYLSTLFFPKKAEPSFSEKLILLGNSPYTEAQDRNKRLIALKKKGYNYKKDYDFISYEPGENGNERSVSFDEVILPTKKTEKLLGADYPVLKRSCDKSAIKTGLKIATLFTAGLSLFPVTSAYSTLTPPSQCSQEGSCSGTTVLLSNSNFDWLLTKYPADCFELTENINLSAHNNLPFFKNCSRPFSGGLKTGHYMVHAGNNTSPLFGCINQAKITGNFNLCANNSTHNLPVIAEQVVHENILTIQQTDGCGVQYPLLGNITGNNNKIYFIGTSGEINSKKGTGIIASEVSGNNNIISMQDSQLYNTPVTFIGGGNNNTYYQKNMNITKFTDNKSPDNSLLVSDSFTGNKATIIQKNVNANLITAYSHNPNKNISAVQNGIVTTFSANSFTQISPALETVRLTNASDNSEKRSLVQNDGRFEIYRDNKWQAVCEGTLHPKSAHAACKSIGYIEAKDEATRIGLRRRLTIVELDPDPVHITRKCTGYERHLELCALTDAETPDSCPENREALLSCSEKPTIHYPDIPFRLTDYTSGDLYRFDTTNTGTGRLEYNDNGDYVTVCTHGFNSANAQAACSEMGFEGGRIIYPNQQPLGKEIGQVMRLWSCSMDAQKLSLCPESASNVNILRGCSHESDVILLCNRVYQAAVSLRLTDRHSIDENRADISKTGLGRLEVKAGHLGQDIYTALCPELSSHVIQDACRHLGFDTGRKFYLSGKPLSPVINEDDEEVIGISLVCTNRYFCITVMATTCRQSSENLIVSCTNTSTSEIQPAPKYCPQTPVTTTFFSGSYNWTTYCNTNYCPLKQWDDYSTEVSANIYNLCTSTQQQNTQNSDGWLKIWNSRCAAATGHCNSCHLPYEQLLGLITDNNQPEKIFLISRQTYPDNAESLNAQGLVLLNRLLSENPPQILHSVKEMLAADACPVNHIMAEQQLLGLYSGGNNTNTQLLWLSPEPGSDVYYAKTLSVNGKPLLITNSSVFIQDTNSSIIRQYPLEKTVANNTVMFNINNRFYKNIVPPERINNILAAVLKNDQLHLATTLIHDKTHLVLTNGQGTHDAYLISYNISENSWSCITEPVNSINAKNIHNYNMVVDDDNQVQFLIRELTSIPESGGCISLPGRMPLKLMGLPIESLENSTQSNDKNNTSSSGNEVFAMLAVIPVVFVSSFLAGRTCRFFKDKRYLNNSDNQKNKENLSSVPFRFGSHYTKGSAEIPALPLLRRSTRVNRVNKDADTIYHLVPSTTGKYFFKKDVGSGGYVICKSAELPSQYSGGQYSLVANLTRQQKDDDEYITIENPDKLLTLGPDGGVICYESVGDPKHPGQLTVGADNVNNNYDQDNFASHYKFSDQHKMKPSKVTVVDVYDALPPPKELPKNSGVFAQQRNSGGPQLSHIYNSPPPEESPRGSGVFAQQRNSGGSQLSHIYNSPPPEESPRSSGVFAQQRNSGGSQLSHIYNSPPLEESPRSSGVFAQQRNSGGSQLSHIYNSPPLEESPKSSRVSVQQRNSGESQISDIYAVPPEESPKSSGAFTQQRNSIEYEISDFSDDEDTGHNIIRARRVFQETEV